MRSAPATTWALVATRPGATTQPLPTWACRQESDSARTCTTEASVRTTSGSLVTVPSGAATGAIGSGPSPSNTLGKTLPSKARVISSTRPSADDGTTPSSAETTADRATMSRATRGPLAATAPATTHVTASAATSTATRPSPESTARRLGAVITSRNRRASSSMSPWPSRAAIDHGGDEGEHARGRGRVDVEVVLEQPGHEAQREERPAQQPHQARAPPTRTPGASRSTRRGRAGTAA